MQKPIIYQITRDSLFSSAIDSLIDSSRFVVVPFQSVDQYVAERQQDCVGCVLLDVSTHDADPGLLYSLSSQNLHMLPVIACIGMSGPPAKWLVESGVFAVLEREEFDRELFDKLERALKYCGATRELFLRATRSQSASKKLTSRQVDIVEKMLKGKGNKGIAFELGLSTRTIEIERAAILRIFRVINATELAHHLGQYQGIACVSSRFTGGNRGDNSHFQLLENEMTTPSAC